MSFPFSRYYYFEIKENEESWIHCKLTLHLRCHDSSWRSPWVASNIVCAREWVIFSIILYFTPHFQRFKKTEMTKDVYTYYIKINKTWEKISVTDLINLWDDFTFFNCSRSTFFSLHPKKKKALNKGTKDVLKLVGKTEHARQKENYRRSKNEVQ